MSVTSESFRSVLGGVFLDQNVPPHALIIPESVLTFISERFRVENPGIGENSVG